MHARVVLGVGKGVLLVRCTYSYYLVKEVHSVGPQFPNKVPPGEQSGCLHLLMSVLHRGGQEGH